MADPTPGQLLDCGHVGQFAGVCQYNQCGKRLCGECVATCEVCGRVLCRRHRVLLDDRRRVFCPDDTRGYLLKKFALRLLGRT